MFETSCNLEVIKKKWMSIQDNIVDKRLLALLFFMCVGYGCQAQKVYSVSYSNQADVKVFVVDYANQADLKVYKVKYANQAEGNEGHWFFTEYANQAYKKVYFVDYANQADLKIYFVAYSNQAGWVNKAKQHWLY